MQIHTIPCGTLKVSATEMIRPLNREGISRKYAIDADGRMILAMNALLVMESDRVLLIDPGCAEFLPRRWSGTYGLEIGQSLEEHLAGLDLVPEQVTDVVFTHLHFDHGSGAFRRSPGSIGKRFPDARYHVLKAHFNYAKKPHRLEAGSFFTRFFQYIDKVAWLEDWKEKWIEFLPFYGHTRGMVVPLLHSGGQDTYYLSDLVPMTIFMEEPIYSHYDLDPELALKEKRSFLNEIKKPSRFILFHDPLTDSIIYP